MYIFLMMGTGEIRIHNSLGSGESSFECSTSAGVKAEMIVPSPILQEEA